MTTAKQTGSHQQGKGAAIPGVEDRGALIPVQRIEALMAMGRAFPPVVTALSLCLLGTVGLSTWLVYRDTQRVPVYFATDNQGRAIEMQPLHEPAVSKEKVAQYVVTALTETLSMDFLNVEDTQARASRYYTDPAFNELVKNFTDQGHYELLKSRKAAARAVATGAPRVVSTKREDGSTAPYEWVVQVPIAWTFSGAQKNATLHYIVQAVVTRQSTLERDNGIAITSIAVSTMNGAQ